MARPSGMGVMRLMGRRPAAVLDAASAQEPSHQAIAPIRPLQPMTLIHPPSVAMLETIKGLLA